MSKLVSRALVAALFLSIPAAQGCDACGDKKSSAVAKKTKAKANKKGKNKKKRKGKTKKKSLDAGLAPQSGVAAAVHVGDQALLWTEGRTNALGRKVSELSWSSEGFEWASMGGAQVLAPGGALYWRFGPSKDARPLADLLTAPKAAPAGYELTASAGRGGNYKLGLKAPGERNYRLGMSRDTPKATAWLEGKLQPGVKATAPLAKDISWPRDASGQLSNALPTGLSAVEAKPASAEQAAAWTPDLQKLAGADAKLVATMMVDLDRDGAAEGLACMDKTSGDYNCFVIDIVGDITQYHGVKMPFQGGAEAPLPAKMGDSPYVVFTGRPLNAKDTTDPLGHGLFYDGGAYQVSLHR
jgi:hypothetical protein